MFKNKLGYSSNRKKGIFSANFEESRKIANKEVTLQDINVGTHIILTFVFICFYLLSFFVYFLTSSCVISNENIFDSALTLFKAVGVIYSGFQIILLIVFFSFPFIFRNIKYIYSMFLPFFSMFNLFFLVISFLILLIYISYNYSALLGTISILMYILLFIHIMIKQVVGYKKAMYQDKINYNTMLNYIIKWTKLLTEKYGIWCIGILFILKVIFNHQNFNKDIVYIFGIIASIMCIKFMIELSFRTIIQFYYIIKYPEEYRQLYKYSKEEWYGKKYRGEGK